MSGRSNFYALDVSDDLSRSGSSSSYLRVQFQLFRLVALYKAENVGLKGGGGVTPPPLFLHLYHLTKVTLSPLAPSLTHTCKLHNCHLYSVENFLESLKRNTWGP